MRWIKNTYLKKNLPNLFFISKKLGKKENPFLFVFLYVHFPNWMALPNCNEGFNNSFWLLQFLREVSSILAKDKLCSRYVRIWKKDCFDDICNMHSVLWILWECNFIWNIFVPSYLIPFTYILYLILQTSIQKHVQGILNISLLELSNSTDFFSKIVSRCLKCNI